MSLWKTKKMFCPLKESLEVNVAFSLQGVADFYLLYFVGQSSAN